MSVIPLWAIVVIGVAIALLAIGAAGGILLWKRLVRRAAEGLVRRREAALAVRRSLEEVVRELSEASDEELIAFTEDPDSVVRAALAEVALTSQVLAEELNTIPLPRHLVPTAEALADAVSIVHAEASRTGPSTPRDAVLTELGAIDLEAVVRAFELADQSLKAVAEEYGIEEPSVYGGGLYI